MKHKRVNPVDCLAERIHLLLLLRQVREPCTLLLRLHAEVRVVHKRKLASQPVCGQVPMPIPLVLLTAVTPV